MFWWFLFLFFFSSGFVFVCCGLGFVLLLDCCWCCSCFLYFLFLLLLFLEGLRPGEVAQRATSLGPKPSFLFVFVFFFCYLLSFLRFPFFDLNWKPCFLLPRKAIVVHFSVFPFVSLLPFLGIPLLHCLFICLSLSLSLSISLVFFSFLASCFSCQFLVLVFVIGLFAFCFKNCFSPGLLSCFVLNHNLRFVFILHLLLLLLSLFLFCCFHIFCLFFLIFGYLWKTSLKIMEIWKKKTKMKNTGKTDILTRAISTGVFTNSVCVCLCACFLCFLNICIFGNFCWKLYKNGFHPPPPKKKRKYKF